jgi:transposase
VAPIGSVFDRTDELLERLQHGPGEEARQELAATPDGPPPSRWTLRGIRATFAWLHDYTLSGVWRVLQRAGLRVRAARLRHYSPDAEYGAQVAYLEACLREAATQPDEVVLVFLDEMGYYRWPDAARTWGLAAPAAPPTAQAAGPNNQQWRIIGALNALTGQVDYLDGYIVGRAKLITFYQQLARAYPHAQRIYVVQDNWSIHTHPEVLAALDALPQIAPVWLPTYAPWLNPIEKLWRWLREAVLKLHRLADAWAVLRQRVHAFLDQFADGSHDLLRYVGLLGEGKLAQALQDS